VVSTWGSRMNVRGPLKRGDVEESAGPYFTRGIV
jgi:hypothetical protein